MSGRRARLPALAVAAALTAAVAAGAGSGCDVRQAVDCARLALAVSGSAEALEAAVLTAVIEDDLTAFEELSADVAEVRDRVRDTDVREAADSVAEAAENIREAAERGTEPDLSPLADATEELAGVCTPGD